MLDAGKGEDLVQAEEGWGVRERSEREVRREKREARSEKRECE
jgi:hypothetical protein